MAMKRLEDMTLPELLRQFARQRHILNYRMERGESTEEPTRRLAELRRRIVELGGEPPR